MTELICFYFSKQTSPSEPALAPMPSQRTTSNSRKLLYFEKLKIKFSAAHTGRRSFTGKHLITQIDGLPQVDLFPFIKSEVSQQICKGQKISSVPIEELSKQTVGMSESKCKYIERVIKSTSNYGC